MASSGALLSENNAVDELIKCQMCLYHLDDPYMLKDCLHSFCKACIDEIPLEKVGDAMGKYCPVCKLFCNQNNIRQNDFITNLCDLHKVNNKNEVNCKQCTNNVEPTWVCMDCKIELCSACKVSHLMIPILKDHKVIPLDHDLQNVIDKLVVCPVHDKPFELNCQQCERPICFKCKVSSHDTHKTEDVNVAIKRLLPQLRNNTRELEGHFHCIESQVTALKKKIEDTKTGYADCKKQVTDRIEDLIERLRNMKSDMEEQLSAKEIEYIGPMECRKLQLEGKLNRGKHLIALSNVIQDKARNMSLLSVLQHGVLSKLRKQSSEKPKEVELHIIRPWLRYSLDETKSISQLKLAIGEIEHEKINQMVHKNGEAVSLPYRCDNFGEVFIRNVSKKKEISIPDVTTRMSFINGMLWIPLPTKNRIMLLHSPSGEVVRYHFLSFEPKIVRNTKYDELIIGGIGGIYVTNNQFTPMDKLDSGNYCDVSVYDDSCCALELTKKRIVLIQRVQSEEKGHRIWESAGFFHVHGITECHFANTLVAVKDHVFVTSYHDKAVLKYTYDGRLLQQYKWQDSEFSLCCLDKEENLAVANIKTGQIRVMNTSQKPMRTKALVDLVRPAADMVIDEEHNIWVLQQDKDMEYKLIKYVAIN